MFDLIKYPANFSLNAFSPKTLKYIMDTMGEKYAEGVILDLEKTWEESDPRTPLICFLSMGSDPTDSIIALGKRLKIETRCVSMGQGQEVHARKLLQQTMYDLFAKDYGGWVLLQNCHLGLDFMDELMDTIVETEIIHEAFRLWMTTEVHKHFPITLLQMSIKFTNEPPQGLKAVNDFVTGVNQDLLDISNMVQWKPMLYAVAFLHSTVQERRKFGPLGWNIPYEFNQADFNATVQFGVSWNTVRYMIGEIQYGGRVTDDYDKRLLNTFAKVCTLEESLYYSLLIKCTDWPSDHKVTLVICTSCCLEQGLPAYDTPEVFGLHPNADITYQSKLAKDVLDTILSIQPKDSSSGSGETREAVVARLADDMLEKLPADYVPFEVRVVHHMSPLKKCSIQPRYFLCLQPLSFEALYSVVSCTIFFLSNKGWALDSVVLCSEVTKWMNDDISTPPSEGVYVYGLYLEGAGWDKRNMKLIESKPKVLFEPMPVIRIYAENNKMHRDTELSLLNPTFLFLFSIGTIPTFKQINRNYFTITFCQL
uniref:Uncharacterized protein n=1 Tax=Laticauda laticaudata TaxID=8630 RepID=A0A8C5SL22_LATLA